MTFRREQPTLTGLAPPSRPPPPLKLRLACAQHEARLSRIERQLETLTGDVAHTRGQVDVLVAKLCARSSSRPAGIGVSAKTVGAIVGALGAAAAAAGATWGWLG